MIALKVLFALIVISSAQRFNYDGYKVYRVQPKQDEDLKVLAALRNNEDIDFWSPLRRDRSQVDIMVKPHVQDDFEKYLEDKAIQYEIFIDNVERIVQEEHKLQLSAHYLEKGEINFDTFHRHDVINDYLNRLATDASNLVSIENIGKSYEGRDLKLIKISTNSSASKPIIYIDAAIHAREWIAPPVALYAINQLVENPENLHLLDYVDFHILPVLNPDGYEYTHLHDRFWRKTRTPGTTCYGTDANRNFDIHWAETGSSSDECSLMYHGKHAFSEPETDAVRNYVLRNKDRIELYLSFHSYGKLILHPWGYTRDPAETVDVLGALGELAAKSIKLVAGTTYTVGSFANALYLGSGTSVDWVYGVAGVPFAYTIELPRGGSGFDPPPEQIWPTVIETWEAIRILSIFISIR